jgi:hypothetical protein
MKFFCTVEPISSLVFNMRCIHLLGPTKLTPLPTTCRQMTYIMERFNNRTLLEMLAKSSNGTEMGHHAYRVSLNSSTAESPYILLTLCMVGMLIGQLKRHYITTTSALSH